MTRHRLAFFAALFALLPVATTADELSPVKYCASIQRNLNARRTGALQVTPILMPATQAAVRISSSRTTERDRDDKGCYGAPFK